MIDAQTVHDFDAMEFEFNDWNAQILKFIIPLKCELLLVTMNITVSNGFEFVKYCTIGHKIIWDSSAGDPSFESSSFYFGKVLFEAF